MKKIKLINSLAAVAALTTIIPTVALSSCGEKNAALGNLMSEYTPTIGQRVRESFASADKTVETYLSAVKTTPEIFVQDFRYTLSRGLPEYISYVSKFCEIKEHNFNIEIDPSTVSVDETRKTVQFDAKINVVFDYTGTKPQEMKWYEINVYRFVSEASLRFVFDFNTSNFTTNTPYGALAQMTTLAGATQLGVSEIGSTVQILNRNGYYIDLDGIEHKFNTTEATNAYHFMMPSEQWWSTEEYVRIYNEISQLWYSYPDVQAFILLFKYYMGTSIYDLSSYKIPTSFDFGSYYMANATLDDAYTFGDVDTAKNTCSLYGFNLSLDSINHASNFDKCDIKNGELKLPATDKTGNYNVSILKENAFNSQLIKYTNIGLTDEITSLVIPANYSSIGMNAVSNARGLTKLTLSHTGQNVEAYPFLSENAFVGLTNVKTIDLSTWNANIDELISKYQYQGKNAFAQIHKGIIEQDADYGTIIIPNVPTEQAQKWITLLSDCFGLKVQDGPVTEGWKIQFKK